MAIWMVVLFGFLALSFDVGRLFINKNESQAFCDAASLTAARYLDGTTDGIDLARAAATNHPNKWNFDSQALAGIEVEFATPANPEAWVSNPSPASNYTRVKVAAASTQSLFFMPVIQSSTTQVVRGRAVAEQALLTSLSQGAFPFAPLAFDTVGPHFGLVPGQSYTIRYPSSKNEEACVGDQVDPNHAKEGSNRGYWGDSSASILRARVLTDYQSGSIVTIGSVLDDVGGAKTTIASSLNERGGQDSDPTTTPYSAYRAAGNGNGRRVVIMPIQDLSTDIVLGVGMFFMDPQGSYGQTGNSAWCVEYVGLAALPNSPGPGAGSPGAYQIKLVQ